MRGLLAHQANSSLDVRPTVWAARWMQPVKLNLVVIGIEEPIHLCSARAHPYRPLHFTDAARLHGLLDLPGDDSLLCESVDRFTNTFPSRKLSNELPIRSLFISEVRAGWLNTRARVLAAK